jgi:hypothetical protein
LGLATSLIEKWRRSFSYSGQSRDMSQTPDINSSKVTERINATALRLLERHPEGLRWTDLRTKIEESDPSFHPKTVNGCVWKLAEKYPDKVYKPSKGHFRLTKHK